ncbi:MAG: hypothetical protein Q8P56_06405, partial [Candidatus Uhrbacteria bacterium]|nr:hypothetical protein [Candidatus Uhrbacteria bacterium]
MEQLLLFLQNHFPYLVEHKYTFLLIAASIEGLNTMILAGFLVSIGGLALIPAALICLTGELLNSYFWYGVGYASGGKSIAWYTRKNPKRERLVEKIRGYLNRHTGKIILIS